jgi:hypothetical protein
MRLTILSLFALLILGCPAEKQAPGGNAGGLVVGAEFDGTPLTLGKGAFENKPVVITWFATW